MLDSTLTPLEWWEIVAVVIATLFLSVVCMVGLWSLTSSQYPPRQNYRLSRIQQIVHWLSRHGKAWRVR